MPTLLRFESFYVIKIKRDLFYSYVHLAIYCKLEAFVLINKYIRPELIISDFCDEKNYLYCLYIV